MGRLGRIRCLFYSFSDSEVLKLALRNTAENTVGVTGWAEINWCNVAHHQVSQRFMVVTVNQHRASCWSTYRRFCSP